MKLKEKEAVKSLSAKEMESELRQAREKYFKLRFRHKTVPLKNPLELRVLRRRVALLETLIHEKHKSS